MTDPMRNQLGGFGQGIGLGSHCHKCAQPVVYRFEELLTLLTLQELLSKRDCIAQEIERRRKVLDDAIDKARGSEKAAQDNRAAFERTIDEANQDIWTKETPNV